MVRVITSNNELVITGDVFYLIVKHNLNFFVDLFWWAFALNLILTSFAHVKIYWGRSSNKLRCNNFLQYKIKSLSLFRPIFRTCLMKVVIQKHQIRQCFRSIVAFFRQESPHSPDSRYFHHLFKQLLKKKKKTNLCWSPSMANRSPWNGMCVSPVESISSVLLLPAHQLYNLWGIYKRYR